MKAEQDANALQKRVYESRIEEQMIKDLRETKGQGCGCLLILAALLFTTTSYAFIPFPGWMLGILVLAVVAFTLLDMLLPARVRIWYWRMFNKIKYEEARRAAKIKLSHQKEN
jgi:hypothetical protein